MRPVRTPCEAAWRVRAYRDRVLAWLVESGSGGRRALIFAVRMPDGMYRFALFVRDVLVVRGARLIVVRDNLSATVFAGRPSYAEEPPPAPRACAPRSPERKGRTVRRKARRARRS